MYVKLLGWAISKEELLYSVRYNNILYVNANYVNCVNFYTIWFAIQNYNTISPIQKIL